MIIRNIIFDFGGVIINIHHSRVETAFKELGITDFDKLFNKASQSDLFQKLEIGSISPEKFRYTLKEIIGKDIPDSTLDEAWNQIIGNYNSARIDLLKKLKQTYKLFLLSNTNIIHYNYYIPKFHHEFGYDFLSIFDKTYWSFKIGKRKPDRTAYSHVLLENNLCALDTLFIDDSIQNIETARQMGFQTALLRPEMDLTDLFHKGRYIYHENEE